MDICLGFGVFSIHKSFPLGRLPITVDSHITNHLTAKATPGRAFPPSAAALRALEAMVQDFGGRENGGNVCLLNVFSKNFVCEPSIDSTAKQTSFAAGLSLVKRQDVDDFGQSPSSFMSQKTCPARVSDVARAGYTKRSKEKLQGSKV